MFTVIFSPTFAMLAIWWLSRDNLFGEDGQQNHPIINMTFSKQRSRSVDRLRDTVLLPGEMDNVTLEQQNLNV